ncbi:hypothetical protein EGM88_03690 [Aureibaculum marinum]|uniref:Cytochrome c domain-containing protein n=1 Tax=Aureibaculum marinum TaxID=2487930 RepID=A0A3N4P3Z5_9FLAO|nr:hypothetical protein [Aureibaculum marinum]RPD99656.1 hypothetical protein EGM88_03690 [Aureibaculum marinum]
MRIRQLLFLLITLFFLTSCAKSEKAEKENKAEEMQMYEPSEMALLMRQMYEFNKVTKARIINKDSLLSFPEEFVNIHKAVLTDPDDRDVEFDSLAVEFINYQKATFSTTSDSTAFYFNQSINSCIQCHQTRCTGPIPKIKKLLIN